MLMLQPILLKRGGNILFPPLLEVCEFYVELGMPQQLKLYPNLRYYFYLPVLYGMLNFSE